MRVYEGDRIIHLLTRKVHVVKYYFSNLVVVDSGEGYDMPLRRGQYVIYSPLMEELI